MADAAAQPTLEPTAIRTQLGYVLSGPAFQSAERSSRILRFLVEETLAGRSGELKEYNIGVGALGRPESFDPRIDSIARVEISRLRSRLEQYYATAGKEDAIVFGLPRGSYIPRFEVRPPADSIGAAPAAPTSQSRLWIWLAAGACVLALGASILTWQLWRSEASSAARPMELDIALPAGLRLANVVGTQLAVSPDGSMLVFVASRAQGGSELWLRRLDRRDTNRMLGTEGGRGPFFSPDGEWVAFWSGGKLKKIAVRGGTPTVICDAPDLLGGSWGDNGQIVAALTTEAKLWRVPASGGTPETLLDLSSQTSRLLWPQVLPGSGGVIFSNVGYTPDSGSVEIFSMARGTRNVLIRNGSFGRFLPSGHLVYVNQGTLYAQRFKPEMPETTGSPVAMIAGISQSPVFGFAQFDFSSTGLLVYQRRAAGGQFSLNWVDPNGTIRQAVPDTGAYLWPRVSPDGREATYTAMVSGESHVWRLRPGGAAPIALTPDGGQHSVSTWTPDGRFLVMQGRGTLEWMPTGSPTSPPKVLLKGGMFVPWSFTPDGKRLAFTRLDPATHFDLWTVPVEVRQGALRFGTAEPFLRTKAVETYPSFSPDGKWIAYVSLQSGVYEVYVRAFPDDGKEVQISRGGGRLPAWNRQRQEILYETEDYRLMSVSWSIRDGVFVSGVPRLWSSVRLANTGVLPNFDLAPDGRILALMADPLDLGTGDSLSVSVDFFRELEKRLGR